MVKVRVILNEGKGKKNGAKFPNSVVIGNYRLSKENGKIKVNDAQLAHNFIGINDLLIDVNYDENTVEKVAKRMTAIDEKYSKKLKSDSYRVVEIFDHPFFNDFKDFIIRYVPDRTTRIEMVFSDNGKIQTDLTMKKMTKFNEEIDPGFKKIFSTLKELYKELIDLKNGKI